jgi:NADH-quinone oxidoreductase subunit G
MPSVLIDNHELPLPAGRKLNAIEAARMVGVEIPHYCWHPGLSVVGSCRMCLVELGTRNPKTGKITMQPKLVPACNLTVADNMVIVTSSEKVARARAMVEEGLLLRHPIDCPICDKAGECKLQDYHFLHGQNERRADLRPFTSRRRDLGDITLFVDRCVMCSRCVRFTQEISGTKELMTTGRGAHEEIDVVDGFPLHNDLSGNVVDLCPVGALCDKDFLYRQRVWFMRRHPGVCTGCSTGCSIWIDENQDRIYRIAPRENPFVNKWWICNFGRYDYHHVHDPRRLCTPHTPCAETGVSQTPLAETRASQTPCAEEMASIEPHDHSGTRRGCDSLENPIVGGDSSRRLSGVSPAQSATAVASYRKSQPRSLPATWDAVANTLSRDLRSVGRLAAVVSPHLTVEEAYLLCKLIRGIDPQAILALGPIPTAGKDEVFPSGFVIRAEKCPNRRGVEAVLVHFAKQVMTFDQFLPELDRGSIQGVWVAGGYKDPWIDDATAVRFNSLKLLVVQDLFPSPLSERASYLLPGAAYAERDGSYVNRADWLQSSSWAIRPPLGVRTEGSLLWELLGRKGLYDSQAVLEEVAREIRYFSAVIGAARELGVSLRANLFVT